MLGREGRLKQDVRSDPRPVAKLSHTDQTAVRKLAECHSLKGARRVEGRFSMRLARHQVEAWT